MVSLFKKNDGLEIPPPPPPPPPIAGGIDRLGIRPHSPSSTPARAACAAVVVVLSSNRHRRAFVFSPFLFASSFPPRSYRGRKRRRRRRRIGRTVDDDDDGRRRWDGRRHRQGTEFERQDGTAPEISVGGIGRTQGRGGVRDIGKLREGVRMKFFFPQAALFLRKKAPNRTPRREKNLTHTLRYLWCGEFLFSLSLSTLSLSLSLSLARARAKINLIQGPGRDGRKS